MKLVLVPVAPTEWSLDGRLLGRTELPLGDDWPATASRWAQVLREAGVTLVLHSPDGLATQTATTLAKALRVRRRGVEDLAEVDFGVWAGLTDEQLAARYSSAFRQLEDAALSVHPPGGEPLRDAAERLRIRLQRLLRRHRDATAALVLRPAMLGLALWKLRRLPAEQIWTLIRDAGEPVLVAEVTAEALTAPE